MDLSEIAVNIIIVVLAPFVWYLMVRLASLAYLKSKLQLQKEHPHGL